MHSLSGPPAVIVGIMALFLYTVPVHYTWSGMIKKEANELFDHNHHTGEV